MYVSFVVHCDTSEPESDLDSEKVVEVLNSDEKPLKKLRKRKYLGKENTNYFDKL